MISKEYSNSVNTTSRTLAAQARPIVYVSQSPSGMWHWNRRNHPGSCAGQSKERFATEQDALEAAAEIATSAKATLKVTPRQQVTIILYWMDKGRQAFAQGTLITLIRNPHMRQGWWWAAEDQVVYAEAYDKPGLDAPDAVSLTLEEALALQEQVVAERIAANAAVLAREVR